MEEATMSDDPNKRGPQDRERINIHEDHELRYWTQKWQVTPDELKAAVHKVGPMANVVHRELQRRA
jgi:hypothetical protein